MDRFIVEDLQSLRKTIVRLKSNMDRFIVVSMLEQIMPLIDLKSNMDRFIDQELQDEYDIYLI